MRLTPKCGCHRQIPVVALVRVELDIPEKPKECTARQRPAANNAIDRRSGRFKKLDQWEADDPESFPTYPQLEIGVLRKLKLFTPATASAYAKTRKSRCR